MSEELAHEIIDLVCQPSQFISYLKPQCGFAGQLQQKTTSLGLAGYHLALNFRLK